MTGIIFDIKKYAIHDGPGIRTTVFFKGCPLTCSWCHNPESIRLEPEIPRSQLRNNYINISYDVPCGQIGRSFTVQELMHEIEKDVIFYDQSGGGVTFSGGEPLMQPHFLTALLERCSESNIHRVVDTSGFVAWKVLKNILPLVDLFLYDIKLMNDSLHRQFTGVGNKKILNNLERLAETGKEISIRIPLIPEITDTEKNLTEITRYLENLKSIKSIDLLPFNSIGQDKYRRLNIENKLGKLETQKNDRIGEIKHIFEEAGFSVKIGG